MAGSSGYVYVLSNPYMPGLLKIGRSKNGGRKRAVDIFTTGVPGPFRLEFEVFCDDCVDIELRVHESLHMERVNSPREFFKVGVSQAVKTILSCIAEDLSMQIIDADLGLDWPELYDYCLKIGVDADDKECLRIMASAIQFHLDAESLKKAYNKMLNHMRAVEDRLNRRNTTIHLVEVSK